MTRKFGIDAAEAALNEQEKGKGKNAKVFLEDGESILVRIPSLDTCCMTYMAHSWFNEHDKKNSIKPFACDREKGEENEDAFDKASAYLLAEARKRYNPETFVKGQSKPDPDFLFGKKLEPSIRMLFGLRSLKDGKPIIIDLSKKYGEKIKTQIKKAGGNIDKFAFELTRIGSDSNTDYSLSAYLGELTKEEQEFFNAAGEPFDTSLYESSLFFKPLNKQLEDLTKIGFDVTLIGYEKPTVANNTAPAASQQVENHNVRESVLPENDIFDTEEIDNILNQTGSEDQVLPA